MELRIAPTFLFTSLGLCTLLVVYRILAGGDLTCGSLEYWGHPWMLEASVIIDNESESALHRTDDDPPQEKTIAQFLKQKVERGHLSRVHEGDSDEFAGLDYATRALLAELVESISGRAAVAGADQQKGWGLLDFEYGVTRVVRRLVVCSAYRTSLKDFTVITLSPDFTLPTSNPDFKNLPPKDPAVKRTCTWLEDGNAGAPFFGSAREMNETGRLVSNGAAQFRWIGETHGKSYDVMLINCSFPEAVGTSMNGGFLYLNITHGSGESAPTELAPVYRERPDTLRTSLYKRGPRQFQYEFAYCSGPVFTTLTPDHVKQFLMYHYALLDGAVHFFIYDSRGIDANTMAVLQPLIDAGSVTVVNFRKESQHDTWYHSQDLAINDCLYRTRSLARWVLSWDMDEYLHFVPPTTLPALLEQYKYTPWISFGKIDFDLNHCAPNESTGEWAVERMLYRPTDPICGVTCHGDRGSRKWMANPRKIQAGRIHAVADKSKGKVLSTNIARMNHYRGLVSLHGRSICEEVQDPLTSNSTMSTDGKTQLWSDSALASLVTSTLKSSVEALPMFGDAGK